MSSDFLKQNQPGGVIVFLYILISADLLFIALDLMNTYSGYFTDEGFALEKDRGFAEVFQYVKEYWVIVMFCWLAICKSERSYLACSLVFGYILLDDSFRLHERLGIKAANYFGFPAAMSLNPRDFGELMINALAGITLLLLITAAYYWGTAEFRRNCRVIIVMLVLLGVFGVIIDTAHVIAGRYALLSKLLGLMEDGGEMLVMSGICWYVFRNLAKT
jgi:hypothetical protein